MASVEEIANAAARFEQRFPKMGIPRAITAAMQAKGMKSDAVWREVQRELSRRGGVMTARRHAASKLEKIEQTKAAASGRPLRREEQLLLPQLVVRRWWEAGV